MYGRSVPCRAARRALPYYASTRKLRVRCSLVLATPPTEAHPKDISAPLHAGLSHSDHITMFPVTVSSSKLLPFDGIAHRVPRLLVRSCHPKRLSLLAVKAAGLVHRRPFAEGISKYSWLQIRGCRLHRGDQQNRSISLRDRICISWFLIKMREASL